MTDQSEIPLIAKAVTIGGLFFVILAALSGCASTSKIQKALDEQYARGYQEGQMMAKAVVADSADMQRGLMNYREQLRQCNNKLDECLLSGMEK